MLNEFRWALDPAVQFSNQLWFEEGDNKFMDSCGHSQWESHPKEFLHQQREFTSSITAQIPQCRIIVITLGVAEVWYDTKLKTYLNHQPTKSVLRNEPERFELHILSQDDVLAGLESIHRLLHNFGHPDFRLLITTSPVPLAATYSGDDVMTANCYSKSMQRTASAAFTQNHDNVDYFPSYEAVTLGNPDLVWAPDQRHVTDFTVAAIMEHVTQAYAPQKKATTPCIDKIHQLDEQLTSMQGQLTWEKMSEMINIAKQQQTLIKRLTEENTRLRNSQNHVLTATS